MKWIAAVAVVPVFGLCLALPARAQPTQPGAEAAAIEIGMLCADMWSAATEQELQSYREGAALRFTVALEAAAMGYYETNVAFHDARKAYESAYDMLTMTLGQLAGQGLDLAIKDFHNKNIPENLETMEGKLDALIELGPDGVKKALEFDKTNTEVDTLFESQMRFKADMIDKRRAYLRAEAEFDRVDFILRAVDICAEDQAQYLRARPGVAPRTATVEAPPPPVTPPPVETAPPPPKPDGSGPPVVGDIGPPGLGFHDLPTRNVVVTTTEQCRDICVANAECIAWNFIPPADREATMPARCEIYENESYISFTADRRGGAEFAPYISGFGPAAVARSLASIARGLP